MLANSRCKICPLKHSQIINYDSATISIRSWKSIGTPRHLKNLLENWAKGASIAQMFVRVKGNEFMAN